jgi:hypothetical protein
MDLRNSKWGSRIIQAFGVTSILFAAAGVYAATETAIGVMGRLAGRADLPYMRSAYGVMTLTNLAFLVGLTVGGMYLWRLSRRGLQICNFVFLLEIAWFIGSVALSLALGMSGGRWAALGRSISAAAGIGDEGIEPQILTGYPVIALIALNLLRARFPNLATRD